METDEHFITSEEAAKILGVSKPTLTRYLQLGIIEGERFGGKGRPYRIKEDSVKEARRSGLRASAFTCTTPGCSRKARFNSGRCAKHQAEVVLARQQSEPQRPLCRYSEITGEYPACTRKAAIHGLCRGHYISVRYSPEWEINLPEQSRAERCLMPECDLPQMWGGLCRGHNQKVRVTNKGDLDKLLRREVEITPLTTAAHEQFRLWRTLRGQTMEELAKKIGVSRERVRQIEIKLYARLKNSVSQSRQQGRLTASELSYLQATEFPVEHLVFGSEEYV